MKFKTVLETINQVSPVWCFRDIPDNWMEGIPEWVGVGTDTGLPVVEAGTGQPVVEAGMGLPEVEVGMGLPVVEAGTGLPEVEAGMGQPVVEAGIRRRSPEAVGMLHEG